MSNSDASRILGPGLAVPGDPAAVRDLANQLSTIAGQVAGARQRLVAASPSVEWTGTAQAAFVRTLGDVPPELSKVFQSYDAAASSLSVYAGTLDGLQGQAQRIAADLDAARGRLAAASAAVGPAQSDLTRANRAHAASLDPATRASTQASVSRAANTLANAKARESQARADVSNATGRALSNHQAFVDAGARCVAGLNAASALGIRDDWRSWLNRHVLVPGDELANEAGADLAAFASTAGNLIKGIAESFAADAVDAVMLPYDLVKFAEHPSRQQLHHVLDDAAGAITIVALVALAVTTAGAGDLMFAGVSVADEALLAGTVVDASKATLDMSEGDVDAGDVVDLAFDAVGVHGLAPAAERALGFDDFAAPAVQQAADVASDPRLVSSVATPASPLDDAVSRFEVATHDDDPIASAVGPVHVSQLMEVQLGPLPVVLTPLVLR
jgi:hypothetical protein